MSNIKILSIVGARPQFIKEAIIQREIEKYKDIEEILVHTGQHYDKNMSDLFFQMLNIRNPDYNLGIHGLTHGEMTAKMIIELEKIMISEKPDFILLYGDTNSTLAGAIAASKLKLKIAHIESGVRQLPRDMPEEINRRLTDKISNILFCSSKLSVENLKFENIDKMGGGEIVFSGDVMYDLFMKLHNKFDYSIQSKFNLKNNEYIVMTLHRDFNVDNKGDLESILKQVNKLSHEIRILFTIHPRTKSKIIQFNLEKYLERLIIVNPLSYLQLMGLTKNCFKVITDSGGYQKEAYFCGKHACILMEDTGWRELIECGWNLICDSSNLIENVFKHNSENMNDTIYGYGDASQKIINFLRS